MAGLKTLKPVPSDPANGQSEPRFILNDALSKLEELSEPDRVMLQAVCGLSARSETS